MDSVSSQAIWNKEKINRSLFCFYSYLPVNINKHSQLWTPSYNNKLELFHVKIQFSGLNLRSSKFKAQILLSILSQFKTHIKLYSHRFIYTVRFVNLTLKTLRNQNKGHFSPPTFCDGRWPWNSPAALILVINAIKSSLLLKLAHRD